MQPPETYAQWSALLDVFLQGHEDDACLHCMARGRVSWTGGVAATFSQRLIEVVNLRLARLSERLTRDMHQVRDEAAMLRAIMNARQQLRLLDRLARLPSLPHMLRDHLVQELAAFARRAQTSLEDSARHDSSGRLRVALRNNSLLNYGGGGEPAPAPAPAAAVPGPAGGSRPGSRRILF